MSDVVDGAAGDGAPTQPKVLRLDGKPYDQGLTHGRALRGDVAHNIELYRERFGREGRLTPAQVRRRAESYWPVIRQHSAEYADGVIGVADGARVDPLDVVALNVRYEILYDRISRNAAADGCTAFAVAPTAAVGGATLLGQNWDWIPGVRTAVLLASERDRQVLCFTEAGIVGGKIGLSSRGLGLAINGLATTDDDWSRLAKPFHVRCHEVLRADDVGAATEIVAEGDRSCSANFLIADAAGRIVDVEAAPLAERRIAPTDGRIAHTNHFLEPDRMGVTETPSPRRAGSINRLAQMRRLLADRRRIDVDGLLQDLRDHTGYPDSVCRHQDATYPSWERFETVVSVVMDLSARVMWLASGSPCRTRFVRLGLVDGGSPSGAGDAP